MNYLLVENRNIVHLDRPWQSRIFQKELNDLEVNFQVPITEPGYIKINDSFEIFPVTEISAPEHEPLFEHLIGPIYNYFDTYVTGSYTKDFNSIDSIKAEIKNKIATERYAREVRGVQATVQDTPVFIDTSRDVRNIFVQKFLLMSDTDVVNWKFNEGWILLSKTDLHSIILAGAQYIQSQFDWEKNQNELLESVNSIIDLQNFYESVFKHNARGNSRDEL